MRVLRGDVVLADYPYSDRTGSKLRPCLVVQCDQNNRTRDDTIIVMVTSKTRFLASDSSQLLVEANSEAGRQAGLLFDSSIQRSTIVTVDRSFLIRKLGTLPADVMLQVDGCIKFALGL